MPDPARKPIFVYKAVAPDGAVVRGQIEAPDRNAAAVRLRARGHLPLALDPAGPSRGLFALLSMEIGGGRRFGPATLADFVGRLALLLEAGVALEASLALLASSEGALGIRDKAASLLRKLRGGASLGEAMASEASVFPPLVIAMVRAGEASGSLAATLGQLAGYLARAEDVRQSVRSALIYPAVLLASAMGTVLLVLLVVLPQLEPVFADSGARLPLLTRFAFAASTLVREAWWVILLAGLAAALLMRRLLQDPGMRSRLDGLMLRVPVLGLALRRAEAGRFARVLAALLGGGVALSTALALAQPVLANRAFADAVSRIAAAVREGGGLAAPLARAGIFPDLAEQMIRIGEATGRLDSMLLRLAELLEVEVQRTLDRSLALLVPGLTLLLGAVVAGIISSVMLAVLGVNDMIR
jgi:general secretion pathway protein F